LLDRVVFHSKEDMSAGHHLRKAEELLTNFDLNKLADINDLLELQHIKQYFDEDIFLLTWDDTTKNDFKNKADQGTVMLRQFFLAINDANLDGYVESLEFHYRTAFWKLFSYFKVFD